MGLLDYYRQFDDLDEEEYNRGLRERRARERGVAPEQVVVGHGASELLQAAAHVLLQPGDELVTPWPSYPLYPLMAQRAGGRPVAVDDASLSALLDAVGERSRAIVLCNPNDPTGVYVESDAVADLASRLPEHVTLLIDEAYIQFQDVEPEDSRSEEHTSELQSHSDL